MHIIISPTPVLLYAKNSVLFRNSINFKNNMDNTDRKLNLEIS
jgi:hypothetical protein